MPLKAQGVFPLVHDFLVFWLEVELCEKEKVMLNTCSQQHCCFRKHKKCRKQPYFVSLACLETVLSGDGMVADDDTYSHVAEPSLCMTSVHLHS